MTQVTKAESRSIDKLGNYQHGNQQAAINAVSESHTTTSFADVNAALDLMGVAVNELIDKIGEHQGFVADN